MIVALIINALRIKKRHIDVMCRCYRVSFARLAKLRRILFTLLCLDLQQRPLVF